MSTPYALGAVSAVLRSRLTAALAASDVSSTVGGVTVTVLPPDRMKVGAQESNHVNLFLHRVSRNSGWANVPPPQRNAAGDVVASPPVGLDLHYVVSAYGQDAFTTEILLGHAVAAFSDEPVLTRSVIRRMLAPSPPDPTIPASFAQARLADQLERLRITAANPGGEEVARLWASFSAPYRPSAFYDVSVVLIDSTVAARGPFPVLAVGTAAVSTEVPEIDDVAADGPPNTPITDTSTLVITGRALSGPGVAVRVGASSATPTNVTQTELRVPVAAFDPPLRAGLQGFTVTQDVELGDPAVPHAALTSEAVPLALRPTLSFAANAVAVTGTQTVEGVKLVTGHVVATISPPVGREQQLTLSLTEAGAPAGRPARGTTLLPPPENGIPANATTATTVQFAFARVPSGAYVARLRADGVDSPVQIGANGTFDSPKVNL